MATTETIILITLGVVLLISGGVTAWVINRKIRWPYKIVILEKVDGQKYIIAGRDLAKQVSFGEAGAEILYLKKRKKYRTAYGKRIGKNQIAFAVADDGYWYNIDFGDVNKNLLSLGVLAVDRDMRLSHSAIQKGINTRYDDTGFFQKWAVPITIGMLIFAIITFGVTMYFIFEKQSEAAAANANIQQSTKELVEAISKLVRESQKFQTGGSGLIVDTTIVETPS